MDKINCSNCVRIISQDDIYCKHCGKKNNKKSEVLGPLSAIAEVSKRPYLSIFQETKIDVSSYLTYKNEFLRYHFPEENCKVIFDKLSDSEHLMLHQLATGKHPKACIMYEIENELVNFYNMYYNLKSGRAGLLVLSSIDMRKIALLTKNDKLSAIDNRKYPLMSRTIVFRISKK